GLLNDGWIVRTPMPVGNSDILLRGPGTNKLVRFRYSDVEGSPVNLVYTRNQNFEWLQDTSVIQGPWLYIHAERTLDAVGVDAVPDVRVHLDHGTGSYGSMTFADGHLYVLGSDGRLALVEASGKNMKVISTATIPMFVKTSGTSNPVIARGRLYIRDS